MVGLQVENTKDKIVFSIDKNNFTEDVLMNMFKVARLEYLIEKANFDPAVLDISEEIKQDWWDKNQDELKKMME